MSTKIEDLPDNDNEIVSNKILKELNEDEEEDKNSEISEIQVSKKVVIHNSQSNKVFDKVKDSIIVFSIVFALTNTYVLSAIGHVPYIKTLEPHSIIYNIIIALIISILHFIVKYFDLI